jgi:hypothetical protein
MRTSKLQCMAIAGLSPQSQLQATSLSEQGSKAGKRGDLVEAIELRNRANLWLARESRALRGPARSPIYVCPRGCRKSVCFLDVIEAGSELQCIVCGYVTVLLSVVEATIHIQVGCDHFGGCSYLFRCLSVAVPGADVGPIVEKRGKKNVGMSRKRGPLQVKEASEKKRLGFEVQNPCNRPRCGRRRWPNGSTVVVSKNACESTNQIVVSNQSECRIIVGLQRS